MGTKRGTTVRLYASQAAPVWNAIQADGVAFCKEEYIQKKYGVAAPVFLTAYRWFIGKASQLVPPPAGAGFPYWVFADPFLMESGASSYVLTLDVPTEEAVFFDMFEWNKVLQFHPLCESEAQERSFLAELSARGIQPHDVMLTGFYPDLRYEILDSWNRLFRHQDAVRQGNTEGIASLQASVWQIKKDWVTCVNGVPLKQQ